MPDEAGAQGPCFLRKAAQRGRHQAGFSRGRITEMAQQKAVEIPVEDVDDLVDELEPGTKLLKGQYTITRYINSGGFGITYLAKDSLDRDVVIKECFPSAFSRRSKTVVAARSRAHTAELRSVVQLFVKEARSLSKIVHPNIVAVHQVFEDNGTAYMAIDYVDGLDLQQIIDGQGRMPTPGEIVTVTEKLLHAVGFIHSNDMLHRDISPDNVLISKTGEPVLIDFGAAREQASKSNRAMSALRVVKDGYSPQEFYIAGSEQGPWSDLYALGATFYHLIAGEAPVNGQARLAALAEDRPDPYVKLEGRIEGYPPGFLAAIDKALCTLPKQRVQSAAEWLAMFTDSHSLMVSVGRVVQSKEPVDAVVTELMRVERAAAEAVAGKGQAPGFGTPPEFPAKVSRSPVSAPASAAVSPAAPAKSGIGTVQVVAGIAATLAIVGAGVLMMGGKDTPPSAEVTPAASQTAPEPEAETAPATEVAAQPAPEPAPEPDVAASTASATPDTAAPEGAAPAETSPDDAAPVPAAADAVSAAAPAEPTTDNAPALAAPVGVIRANQVSFAAWDIEMPFLEDNRIIGGQRTAIVRGLLPSANLAEAGSWLEPGLLIYSVNGIDVQQSGSIATAILNAKTVDPDGRARVVVEYAGSSLERQSGLLTVPTTRLVSLGNGLNFEIGTVDGQWQTVVTGVTVPAVTDLRQGDVLYRDQTTGIALDGPDALESIMATLAEQGTGVTQFSVLRGNRIVDAAMQLATD
jgi:serine/threonine protein kinase